MRVLIFHLLGKEDEGKKKVNDLNFFAIVPPAIIPDSA